MIERSAINPQAALWIGFFGLILAAWAALFAMVAASPLSGVPAGFWAALCTSAAEAEFPAVLAMWGLMSAAMMLPTFAPALRSFMNLGATGATKPADAVALIAGYLAIWLVAALVGAVLQTALARLALLGPDGSSRSLWVTAALLFVSGASQFSRLKAACLAKCRMPLTFFIERWAPGKARAFRMGVELGALCLGCCWALMALAFVGGTMSLIWMGAATLFMVLEKLPDIGRHLTRPAGYALILAGAITGLRAAIGT